MPRHAGWPEGLTPGTEGQARVVAILRQLGDLVGAEVRDTAALRHVEERGVGGDRDLLHQPRERQAQVHLQDLAESQLQAGNGG